MWDFSRRSEQKQDSSSERCVVNKSLVYYVVFKIGLNNRLKLSVVSLSG